MTMTVINLSIKLNVLDLHRTATELNLYDDDPCLPIIKHEDKPICCDAYLIKRLNEDESLKDTRLQLMHNVVADKHDPTLMYNVLKNASPELTKMISEACSSTVVALRPSAHFTVLECSQLYEFTSYRYIINIIALCAPGFSELSQTVSFLHDTMLSIQQNEISVPELPNIQNEIPAPELNSFLSQINWNITFRQALKSGIIVAFTVGGVAYLIPVSNVLFSITSNYCGNSVGGTVPYSITDGTDAMKSLNNDTHNISWDFVKTMFNFASKILAKYFKSDD
jgi:hypothetical protein